MTEREHSLLKRLYPERDSFSADEVEVVRRLLGREDSGGTGGRCDRLPYIFVPVGGRIRVRGKVYECVKADATILPLQACSGCALRSGRVQCFRYQCSPFDRSDGKFTWFVEVKDE